MLLYILFGILESIFKSHFEIINTLEIRIIDRKNIFWTVEIIQLKPGVGIRPAKF